MEKNIADVEALSLEAREFVQKLLPHTEGATLVTLSGELGVGKTAFAKAAAHALGVEETVNSPTFVLEKVYRLSEGKHFKRFVHIDAYRLEAGIDLTALGFDELMRNVENLIFLEWPEKVSDALPEPAARIALKVLADGSRTISYG